LTSRAPCWHSPRLLSRPGRSRAICPLPPSQRERQRNTPALCHSGGPYRRTAVTVGPATKSSLGYRWSKTHRHARARSQTAVGSPKSAPKCCEGVVDDPYCGPHVRSAALNSNNWGCKLHAPATTDKITFVSVSFLL
jgi:hypothetical protein